MVPTEIDLTNNQRIVAQVSPCMSIELTLTTVTLFITD